MSTGDDLTRADDPVIIRPPIATAGDDLIEELPEGEPSVQRGLPGERDDRESLGYMQPNEGSGPG
jgi:hypothetical protein